MKPFLRQSIQPLRRIWRRFTSDDHIYRLATRQDRASGLRHITFSMSFLRHDYAAILKACGIAKQNPTKFLEEAAVERCPVHSSGRNVSQASMKPCATTLKRKMEPAPTPGALC
jgi:hypothetical protein